ncbi:5'-3' exonuclease [Gynuella sp.]|uniref:5'-3' exonuclease n=1 Tax=Gynuella sp. TaxID=2969146 RepID=UPI003D123E6A
MVERNSKTDRITPPLEHKVLLIDGSIFIFRAWFGWPDRFSDQQGRPVNAVIGFTDFVLRLLVSHPEQMVFCFDASLFSGLRHQLDPSYKANRALPDESLEYQMNSCFELIQALGLPCLKSRQHEADDLMASVQAQWYSMQSVVLVTSDKDIFQLLRPNDWMWDGKSPVLSGYEQVCDHWQIEPSKMPELLALCGDASDNIQGLSGVGAKTAARLLNEVGDLNTLLDQPERVLKSTIRAKQSIYRQIQAHRSRLLLNHQLTRLYRDAPLPGRPDPWDIASIDADRLDIFVSSIALPHRQKSFLKGLVL